MKMSSGQEKSTQEIYTGSLLSQEYIQSQKPLGIYYAIKKPNYNTTHQRSDLEHLKPHTTTQIKTPSDSALTQQFQKIQEIEKGLHLINIQKENITAILFHSFVKIQNLDANLENHLYLLCNQKTILQHHTPKK